MNTCPKCGYQRQPADSGDPGICGGCGLVFAKWVQRQTGVPPMLAPAPAEDDEDGRRAWPAGCGNGCVYVPERTDPILFWGRVALYVAFFVWGWYFILLDFRTNEIGHSFMHRINLVFHEAGHIIFMPFGNFMMTLGGTLGQLLMPVVVMVALIWKNRDSFGASIGLWWLGQSLMDLAPYINDARDLQLMLLGGGTGAGPARHPRLGEHPARSAPDRIRAADRLGADALGTILVLAALCWGAYILYLQYRQAVLDCA